MASKFFNRSAGKLTWCHWPSFRDFLPVMMAVSDPTLNLIR